MATNFLTKGGNISTTAYEYLTDTQLKALLGQLGVAFNFTNVSATTVLTSAYSFVKVWGNVANVDVTLPSAPINGTMVVVRYVGPNTFKCDIIAGGTDTVGFASHYEMQTLGETIWLVYDSDSANWEPYNRMFDQVPNYAPLQGSYVKEVTLTAADILSSNSNPVTVLFNASDYDANFLPVVKYATLTNDAGTSDYVSVNPMGLYYSTGGSLVDLSTGFTAAFTNFYLSTGSASGIDVAAGTDVVFATEVADPTEVVPGNGKDYVLRLYYDLISF